MSQVLDLTFTRPAVGRHDMIFGGIAVAIAAGVFAVDTLTEIEGAIAVLYVIALLLAAEVVSRTGLVVLMIMFIGLTLTSFVFTHGPDPDLQTFLRLSVSMAAVCVTTGLLLRNDRARAELLRINAALRESEARYRSIFDHTRVALWERDYSKLRDYLVKLRGRGVRDVKAHTQSHPEVIAECIDLIEIVAANEAAIELLGSNATRGPAGVMHRFIPTESDAFLSILQALLDGASYFEGNAEVVTDSGERRSVLLSVSFPEDPAAFNRVVVSMVDVTQREEARKALAKAQADLSRASKAATVGALSASLAHELNQPLGAIGVNSQTLMRWLDRDPPDIEAAKRSAERILRDSNRASDIFKNTRSMLSSSPRETETLELAELVNDTLALMEHDLRREETTVEVIEKTKLPKIACVRVEMQQVLINLISNAAQAITAAAAKKRLVTIVLDAPQEAKHVSIAVRDTGDGLISEAREKLFTPFFTTKPNGMGIGLSICRSTIEAIGGSLEGRNHPEGGALFEIKLPKEAASA